LITDARLEWCYYTLSLLLERELLVVGVVRVPKKAIAWALAVTGVAIALEGLIKQNQEWIVGVLFMGWGLFLLKKYYPLDQVSRKPVGWSPKEELAALFRFIAVLGVVLFIAGALAHSWLVSVGLLIALAGIGLERLFESTK